jgi:hypothetical protein
MVLKANLIAYEQPDWEGVLQQKPTIQTVCIFDGVLC